MTRPPENENAKRPAPFSLRLTFEERARLEKAAAGMSLSAYAKWRIFDPDKPAPKTRNKFPTRDQRALAALVAWLGKSRMANNLNQLAKAANSGSLPVTPDTENAINDAANDVAKMKDMLVRALGLQE